VASLWTENVCTASPHYLGYPSSVPASAVCADGCRVRRTHKHRTYVCVCVRDTIIRCIRLIREKAKHSRRIYNYRTRNKEGKETKKKKGLWYVNVSGGGSRYQNYIFCYTNVYNVCAERERENARAHVRTNNGDNVTADRRFDMMDFFREREMEMVE
jgi:hypothetical protein